MPDMFKPFLLAIAVLLPAPALAQDVTAPLVGSWALEADGTAIFRFDIEDAGEEWRGTWLRPASFGSDGYSFVQMKGPPVRLQSMAGLEFAGFVELSFNDPRPGAVPDIFRFTPQTHDRVEMTYVGTNLAPYRLIRVEAGTPPGPWIVSKIYRVASGEAAMGQPDSAAVASPTPSRIESDFLEGF